MNETAVFEEFINGKGLKHSKPRNWILAVFLSQEKHLTIDELRAEVPVGGVCDRVPDAQTSM
jgi:Fe2+ or Zn2+ uptake regulation protein